MPFTGANVLITGAAGNLGRAVAEVFAEQGARLLLADLKREALEAVFGAESPNRLFVPVNLLERDVVKSRIDESLERLPRARTDRAARIDVLCHLAGGFRMGEAVHETSAATWDFLCDLNARTLLNVAAAVVPLMIAAGGGRIVTVGAYSARQGLAAMGAYTAAKASVIRLTEAMSAELREKNINVNCVLPTIIDTPQNRASMPGADPARWVAPADLARVIAFLASDAARAVHGAALPVTGLS
jgi:NAD(P)-dependent dehydrogenase (short-subunit alcohol dehydrogenase family)